MATQETAASAARVQTKKKDQDLASKVSDQDVIVTGRAANPGLDLSTEETAIRSVVKQFRGGEHRLAGARASQLVYGTGDKPNDNLLEKLKSEAPGIERYISAPENPVTVVPDEGGYPLTTQPENDLDQVAGANQSDDQARQEQDEVDAHLKEARDAAEEAGQTSTDPEVKTAIGTTELNPDNAKTQAGEATDAGEKSAEEAQKHQAKAKKLPAAAKPAIAASATAAKSSGTAKPS